MGKRKSDVNDPNKERPGNKPDRRPGNYPPGSEPNAPEKDPARGFPEEEPKRREEQKG